MYRAISYFDYANCNHLEISRQNNLLARYLQSAWMVGPLTMRPGHSVAFLIRPSLINGAAPKNYKVVEISNGTERRIKRSFRRSALFVFQDNSAGKPGPEESLAGKRNSARQEQSHAGGKLVERLGNDDA